MSLVSPRTRNALGRVGKRVAWGLAKYGANRAGQWFANRNSSGGSKKTSKKKGSSGRSVTQHHDMSGVYRRRRMPRRKRMQWKKFVQKVRAVTEKDLGSISVVRSGGGFGTSLASGQGTGGAMLYGLDGSSFVGADDLRAIVQGYNSGVVPTNSRFRFCSAVMDLTFSCIADATDPDSHTMELDLYHMVYRGYTRFANPEDVFTDAAADTPTFGTAGGLDIKQLGCTPFQFPAALSTLKILKKKKYFLSNGHSATYQIRDPKNRIFDTDTIDNHAGTDARPGWTQVVYFIYKHVPVAAGNIPAIGLSISCTRAYRMKKFETAARSDGLV